MAAVWLPVQSFLTQRGVRQPPRALQKLAAQRARLDPHCHSGRTPSCKGKATQFSLACCWVSVSVAGMSQDCTWGTSLSMNCRQSNAWCTPADKLVDEGMPQCWQSACVWMQWVRYAQHQDLISTNDHAYALNIHHQSFLSDENCCGVRNWSLQAQVACLRLWCCSFLVQSCKAGSDRLCL